MTTPFEQAASMTSAAVISPYGELFTFTARASPATSTRRADGAGRASMRPAAISAVELAYLHARGSIADDHAQGDVVSKPLVSVTSQSALMPMTGDQVTRQKPAKPSRSKVADGVRHNFRLTARKRS